MSLSGKTFDNFDVCFHIRYINLGKYILEMWSFALTYYLFSTLKYYSGQTLFSKQNLTKHLPISQFGDVTLWLPLEISFSSSDPHWKPVFPLSLSDLSVRNYDLFF